MIWFREMHEQHTVRFDGRGGRVEEGPRTERAGWNLEEGTVPSAASPAARRFGCRAVNCLQRQVRHATGQERARMNVEQRRWGVKSNNTTLSLTPNPTLLLSSRLLCA